MFLKLQDNQLHPLNATFDEVFSEVSNVKDNTQLQVLLLRGVSESSGRAESKTVIGIQF